MLKPSGSPSGPVPVMTASQYPEIVTAFDSMMGQVAADDQARFWGENAAAAYRM